MAACVRKAAHDIETRSRTDDVVLSEGIDFTSLLLSQPVLDGLSASGFEKPSPIQLKAIPLGRCGLDLIVQAKSGTGKTCVFSTIALDSLILENVTTQVLVLAPTREIAVQIHSVLMAIGSAMEGLQCHVFIGGTAVSQDKVNLKRCHIAVGSPGRIKQLIELGMLSTASVRLFVLDEADKLLEEGSFQEQINWIFSSLPANKQMLALSATYPESLAKHLTRYMREPTFVRLNPKDPALKGLRQYYKLVNSHAHAHKVFEEKVLHLLELFSKVPFNQALVFSNLHSRAQHLADILSSKGLPAVCISGGLSQDERLEAMSKLKQYQCRVLISTDLTSRGIDAEKVNLVINLDVPKDWETYMHRIGRAGRFGTRGLAVTYCCHGEEENKMMAIAQRCSLRLSVLPSPIEPGLMEESCDWGVSVEASTPGTRPQLFPKQEKKNRNRKPVKVEAPDTPVAASSSSSSSSDQEVSSTSSAPTRDDGYSGPWTKKSCAPPDPRRVKVEESRPKATRPVKHAQAHKAPASQAPTRKELQEALPKIPPLSSFKNAHPDLVTLEEAELDFHDFITEGPGRSVEVIRQFKGQSEDGGPSAHTESHMLHDDGDNALKRALRSSGCSAPRRTPAVKMEIDHPRRTASGSSNSSSAASSDNDDDMEENRPEAKAPQSLVQTQTEAGQRSQVKPGPMRIKAHVLAAPPAANRRHYAPDGGTLGHLEHDEPPARGGHQSQRKEERGPAKPTRDERRMNGAVGIKNKKVKKVSEKRRRGEIVEGQTGGEDEEQEEEEEGDEWSNINDWRAYYRSWEQYYESMACHPQPGYHSYYSQAHSWMAAYRMNTVYMNELLKH
ncbi:putative ATP-dependent RNA helicase DDX20 [Merluccius polli]|uniref:RNA helicase n=1 Tax=Merluccius polli TaxID=89951 RepID=A0AA47N6A6_MERPO|nr:putative ATP-dependent RNA helicase DDX20 [Merluccius polli]